jgi:hypothetical protein
MPLELGGRALDVLNTSRSRAMKASARDRTKTLATHYIDGAFVESHGREVMDVVRPTDGHVIARVTFGDEEDTRRAIAAARRAFAVYGRSTIQERAAILRRLHDAASARIDDLTACLAASPLGTENVGAARGEEPSRCRLLAQDGRTVRVESAQGRACVRADVRRAQRIEETRDDWQSDRANLESDHASRALSAHRSFRRLLRA